MRFEHKDWTIDLSLVGVHHPNSLSKPGEVAKAVWKVALNGRANAGTSSGTQEEVLDEWVKYIDWCLDK